MNKLYVIQVSTDKGKTWMNCMLDRLIVCTDIKRDAKNLMEETYQRIKQCAKRANVKPVARKWYRIKEYVEVDNNE